MKQFKDLGIKPVESKSFVGEKVKMSKILNRNITVHDFKIEPSKQPGSGNDRCLWMQISLGENKHVVFTGSKFLIAQIESVDKGSFPFSSTIVQENERYLFT